MTLRSIPRSTPPRTPRRTPPGPPRSTPRNAPRPPLALALAIALILLSPGPLDARQQIFGAPAAAAEEPPELVVLLHGLGRTSVSMWPLARALEAEGFAVFNWGYSSVCCEIAELGRQLLADLEAKEESNGRTTHFVGHSLGNIIIRWVLTQEELPLRVGKVVMLAPPNQGSQDADRYAPHLAWLLPALPELQTDSASTVRMLEPVAGVPIGVVAGRYDGKVTTTETELAEASDHVVVPATHTFLMFRPDVHRLTIGFLRTGQFPDTGRVRR